MLAVPEITGDEAESLESALNRLIKDAKGTIISFERWGKYKLAYPIRKNDYGVYFLARFEIDEPQALLEQIQSLMKIKLSNLVMRYMVSALSPKQSLAYQRPPSLEETPSRDVDSFLKEHKMEGLLSSAETTKKSTHKPTEKESETSQSPDEKSEKAKMPETEVKPTQEESDKEEK